MARPLRIHIPGMPYHVMSRGNNKQCIFEDDADHLLFLTILAEALDRFAVACLAYCLLWNHFHLLVVPGLHSVSRLMQHLNSKYCAAFNRRHKRVGHLLGDRFKGPIVEDDSYLLDAARYIALNPVESGHVTKPEDWRWSSYRACLGLDGCPPFLTFDRLWTALDADDTRVGRDRFASFVTAATAGEGLRQLSSALYVGGKAVARRVDPLLEPHRTNVDFTYMQRFATRPPLAEILAGAARPSEIDEAAYVAFHTHAYKLREIGAALNRQPATIWAWIQRAKKARGA